MIISIILYLNFKFYIKNKKFDFYYIINIYSSKYFVKT